MTIADLEAQTVRLRDGSTVPLITKVTDNIWFGAYPPSPLTPEFKTSINVHTDRLRVHPDTVSIWAPFEDTEDKPVDGEKVHLLADILYDSQKRGPVLVNCRGGVNRSALVVALYLIGWRAWTQQQAIDFLRESRSPAVLDNKVFEKWLLEDAW